MQTLNPAEIHRRERYSLSGWNLTDDDLPNVPEISPLDSAQAKRWARETAGEASIGCL
jgi:hypothetical protein